MKILNEELSASSKTYKTYDAAVTAANNQSVLYGTQFGELNVAIITFGARFAPIFILSEKQVVLAVSIATSGFLAVRA